MRAAPSFLLFTHRRKHDAHIERLPVSAVLAHLDRVVSKGPAPFHRGPHKLRAGLVQNVEGIARPIVLAVFFLQQRAEGAQNGEEEAVGGPVGDLFAVELGFELFFGVLRGDDA